ncbi:MAG: hypothetical protein SPI30_03335 [Prevotella sp.]|nr:hypothetical protein [Prevotella sp.]
MRILPMLGTMATNAWYGQYHSLVLRIPMLGTITLQAGMLAKMIYIAA